MVGQLFYVVGPVEYLASWTGIGETVSRALGDYDPDSETLQERVFLQAADARPRRTVEKEDGDSVLTPVVGVAEDPAATQSQSVVLHGHAPGQ